MRKIFYKKRQSLENRRKVVSIRECNEDSDCSTVVKKSFVYKVQLAGKDSFSDQGPQIYIKKEIDNKNHVENFSFRIKGSFYLRNGRHGYNVDFCHTLRITIVWKSHIFSPKKSETLT